LLMEAEAQATTQAWQSAVRETIERAGISVQTRDVLLEEETAQDAAAAEGRTVRAVYTDVNRAKAALSANLDCWNLLKARKAW